MHAFARFAKRSSLMLTSMPLVKMFWTLIYPAVVNTCAGVDPYNSLIVDHPTSNNITNPNVSALWSPYGLRIFFLFWYSSRICGRNYSELTSNQPTLSVDSMAKVQCFLSCKPLTLPIQNCGTGGYTVAAVKKGAKTKLMFTTNIHSATKSIRHLLCCQRHDVSNCYF